MFVLLMGASKLILIPFCVVFVVLTIIFLMLTLENTEHFEYIKEIYTPTALERNPLTLFIDSSDAYINVPYIKNVFNSYEPAGNVESPIKIKQTPIEKLIGKKFQKNIPITYSNDSNADMILSTEFNVNLNKYKYLSKMTELKFAYIQIDTPNSKFNDFFDFEHKTIAVKRGYTATTYNELWKKMNVYPKKIIYYDDENDVERLVRTCDAIATLMLHPNAYIAKLSNTLALRVVPWSETDKRFDSLKETMQISKTTISLKDYNFINIRKNVKSRSIDLNLYVRNGLDTDIVYDLTELVYRPKGIIRSYALSSTTRADMHSGTRKWLIKNGLLAFGTIDEPVPESCVLLAGKAECSGKNAKFAEKKYEDMQHFNDELGDEDDESFGLDAIPYLKNAEKHKNHPKFGNTYSTVLSLHGNYLD